MSDLVFDLSQASDLNTAGGKAFALGKMIQAGFVVPEGFVISAKAYQAKTPELAADILQSFDELAADFVAVRSSAINEDGNEAAWAGQLDTFLNCQRDNLIEKVQQCWQSAGSARAQSYAKQKGLDSTQVAVIVQKMIQGEISGVAFSAHPVTGSTEQLVIEAGFGLGEAIVSGEVTPDTYIVDKGSLNASEKHLSTQSKMLIKDKTGQTVWQDLQPNQEPKLSDHQISELAKLVNKLEAFFGFPVDVEWTISNDTLYLLQCRPITTLNMTK